MIKKKKQKQELWGIIVLVALAVVAGLAIISVGQPQRENIESVVNAIIEEKPIVCEKIRRLDGLCFSGEKEPLVFSVMIDNHNEARPVFGLNQASLVYETIVEAPITRFLAVFYSEPKVKKIGPVRSARPFFADWALEFDGPYLHVGGSDDALNYLKGKSVFDLNEFSSGKYFWRDYSKAAPHNIFTSTELLFKAMVDKKWEVKNEFSSWKFRPDRTFNENSAPVAPPQTINIDFADAAYSVQWKYDAERGDYSREQSGAAYKDADGNEIRAKNIAVMYAESKVIDSYGRRKTKTVGSGKAVVFSGGEAIDGEWRRSSLSERTRFFNAAGEEIAFLSGTTWIEVVPSHFPKVTY
ncbi:DUF3048 domain-containing protein [Candidatus Falkowbacteria bacterium]|nr:DUF3048 domain-containing protein [Candidatus Falkowbacteria bacterium]